MKKHQKILVVASAVLVLAAGCAKTQPQVNNQPTSVTPSTTPTDVIPKSQTQTRDNAGKPDYTPGYVVVAQTVEGSNLNQPYNKIKDGTTGFSLLDSTHTVVAKDYGSMGKFVESIDGNKPDTKHFWAFYVNGTSSNVGASAYILKDNDKVEWKLELIK